MSRKLWFVLFLAVSTVATFWYGARSNPAKPAAPPADFEGWMVTGQRTEE